MDTLRGINEYMAILEQYLTEFEQLLEDGDYPFSFDRPSQNIIGLPICDEHEKIMDIGIIFGNTESTHEISLVIRFVDYSSGNLDNYGVDNKYCLGDYTPCPGSNLILYRNFDDFQEVLDELNKFTNSGEYIKG